MDKEQEDSSRPALETAKVTPADLVCMKARGEIIAMVTAYDAPSGRLADRAGIDCVLVGDSAAMTVFGRDATTSATMEEMLLLTRAARAGVSRALLVADMPFGSFQVSDVAAVEHASQFVKDAGADAATLDGAGTSTHDLHNVDKRSYRDRYTILDQPSDSFPFWMTATCIVSRTSARVFT